MLDQPKVVVYRLVIVDEWVSSLRHETGIDMQHTLPAPDCSSGAGFFMVPLPLVTSSKQDDIRSW